MASNATALGSVFIPCATTGTPTRSPQSFSWSTAAALNVSAAPSTTDFPLFLNWAANLPMVVVLPTPLTPTTKITCGLCPSGSVKSARSSVLFWARSSAISSLRILSSSEVLRYLSLATRASIRWMILIVVSTPTSDMIRISSNSSSTSSSTFDLPATARPSLLKMFSLVFSKP